MDVIIQKFYDLISPPDPLEEEKKKRLRAEVYLFREGDLMCPMADDFLASPDYKMDIPYSGGPVAGNLSHWRVSLKGPPSSPYEGVTFELSIDLPQNYPHRPMKVTFLTMIFHPNVDNNGNVGLRLLKENNWSPYYSITAVLHLIYHMLEKPSLDLDDVASPHIADMYETDRSKFETIARSRRLMEMNAWEKGWLETDRSRSLADAYAWEQEWE